MSTVPQAPIKAKYATVGGEAATIAKVGGRLYVVFADRIEDFTVAMAPCTVLLGDCQVADDQQLRDQIAGGYAAIACGRVR